MGETASKEVNSAPESQTEKFVSEVPARNVPLQWPVVYFPPHFLERTMMSDSFTPNNSTPCSEPTQIARMAGQHSEPAVQNLQVTPSLPASNDYAVDNPCLSCGACCAHFRVSFYCGEIADGSGAGMVPPELVTQVGPLRAAMKGTEYGYGRCVALSGEVGSPTVHCTIYPLRPSPCREFEPWLADGTPEPDCQRARARFGLPPLPSLSETDFDPQPHAA